MMSSLNKKDMGKLSKTTAGFLSAIKSIAEDDGSELVPGGTEDSNNQVSQEEQDREFAEGIKLFNQMTGENASAPESSTNVDNAQAALPENKKKTQTNKKIQFAMGLSSLSSEVLDIYGASSLPSDNYSLNRGASGENITNTDEVVNSGTSTETTTNTDEVLNNSLESTIDFNYNAIEINEYGLSEDKDQQIIYLKPRPLMAAPITYEDFKNTMCLCPDDRGTTDSTRDRGLLLRCNQAACPSIWDEGILDAIGSNVSKFKVGCAINFSKNFPNYMENFYGRYPETADNDASISAWNEAALLLVRNYCLNAEIIVPISSDKAKVLDVKIVENTFDVEDEIHIMTSFMMLASNKDLWTIKGTTSTDGRNFEEWDNTGAYFAFEKSSYDPIKGEITGFTPAALKSMIPNEGDIKCKFKNVYFNPLYEDHYFVRFYVPSSLRDTAEKILEVKLPDDFCTSKYTGRIITIAVEHIDFSGLSAKAQEIIQKPIRVTHITYDKNIEYQQDIAPKNRNTPIKEEAKGYNIKNPAHAKIPQNYPMINNGGAKINTIEVHALVKTRLETALNDVVNHYGSENMEELIPSACIFSCSVRGSSKSGMHERGLAIDFHAPQNQPYTNRYWATTSSGPKSQEELETFRKNTTFDDPIYQPFLAIMRYHGWRNLGHDSYVQRNGYNDYGDWMHFQAAIGADAKALRRKTLKNIRR